MMLTPRQIAYLQRLVEQDIENNAQDESLESIGIRFDTLHRLHR